MSLENILSDFNSQFENVESYQELPEILINKIKHFFFIHFFITHKISMGKNNNTG